MTEARGRGARWTAAALAAPVVAGVFAAATTWATRADPLHQGGHGSTDSASTPTSPAPSSTTDPAIAALQQQLATQQAAMNKLANQIAAVRAKAAALARQNGASGSGTTTRYAASSAGSAASSSRSSASKSTSANQPAPAPAPTTHGSTGASGTG